VAFLFSAAFFHPRSGEIWWKISRLFFLYLIYVELYVRVRSPGVF
jgi:hypothetical protein